MNNEGLLLLLDLEGIIGFSPRISKEENWSCAERELELLIRTLWDQGFRELTLCVVHNDGTGFPKRLLSKYGVRHFEGIDQLPCAIEGVRWAFLIGFHGMRETGGCFDHSFRMDFLDLMYDGKHLGELGIFTRWFLRRGITPLLVSGEGNFRQELEGIPCLIHSVPPLLSEPTELQRVYEALRETTICALQNTQNAVEPRPKGDDPVSVWVDNSDKYGILADCSYLRIESDHFVFDSIDTFLDNLYPFCRRLNQAMSQILAENMALIERVRVSASEACLRDLLKDYLSRDVCLIDRRDRRIIAEKVGISYETVSCHSEKP